MVKVVKRNIFRANFKQF